MTGPAEALLRIRSDGEVGGLIEIPLSGVGIAPAGDIVLGVTGFNAGGLRLGDAPRALTAR